MLVSLLLVPLMGSLLLLVMPVNNPQNEEKMKVIAITAQILMSRHITLVFWSLAPHPCMDTIGW